MFIALITFLSYGLESIFGFGGTILFLALAGQFADFKTLIYLSMYISFLSSCFILISDYKNFSFHHFKNIMAWALPGIVLGTLLLQVLSGFLLLKVFAVFLLIYALQGLWLPQLQLPQTIKRGCIMLGGLVHGLYSTGGPFILMGYKDRFEHKSQLRATLAMFFALSNLWRMIQSSIAGKPLLENIAPYLWLAAPLAAAVWIGHRIHVKIDEELYRKGILVLVLIAGLAYLAK